MLSRRRDQLAITLMLALTVAVMTSLLLFPDVVSADRQAFLYLNSVQEPLLTDVFWTLTALGSFEFGLIWVGGLWLMRRSDLAAYVLVAVLIEVVVVTLMKEMVLRPRPYDAIANVGWLFSQDTWSFPSGHAAGAFALSTVVGLKVKKTLPLMASIAIVVAFSRVYVGVHYPLDVIAGSLIGILVGLLALNLDLERLGSLLARGRERLGRKLS